MTTKISTLFSCRASEFPDLSSDDSRIKIYAGNVDWMPFWKMKETPKQRCLQSTSTSTFKWKDPQIQSYLIHTPFSFLACTFLLFWHYFMNIESPSVMSSTLIPSSFRVIWEVLHFFFQNPSDWQFHWLWILLILVPHTSHVSKRIGKPHHGTWAHGSIGGNDLIRPGLSWGKHGWKTSIWR